MDTKVLWIDKTLSCPFTSRVLLLQRKPWAVSYIAMEGTLFYDSGSVATCQNQSANAGQG